MTIVHFTSLDNIKNNTLIDTNVNDKYMNVMLRVAEDTWLQEILGTSLFNALKTGIVDNTLTDKQRTLIEDKILNYLYALMEMLAIEYLLTKYETNGVYVNTADNTAQRQYSELSATKVHKVRSVNYYAGLMKKYIDNNINDFEEYNETDEGLPAKKVNTRGFFIDTDIIIEDIEYYSRNATNNKEESI